jgi:hypothetical protein
VYQLTEGNERRNRTVLSRFQKTVSDGAVESLQADYSKLLQQQLRKLDHRQWTVGVAGLQATTTTMIEDVTERQDWRYDKCHVTYRSGPSHVYNGRL